MTRFLAILAALTCAASAQTYRTVTADTNNVIRTNFSLTRSQVSDLTGATFAISNVTGLQSALDGKLATNGSAAGLTGFPSSLLTTNGNAGGLTNFPASLLRTNGDGSGLTNLPNADLGSATGILPLANGGTGTNSAAGARTALELGTAATNDATAFQPASTNLTALASGDGSSLTNVTVTDASTLTNFPSELLRTNGDAAALTNFPSELLRTNGDGSGLSGVAVYPALSNNAGLVLAVTTNETGVEWIAVSNTVTDASTLTNFPASILQTNSADGSFPAFLARTNADGSGFTNISISNVVNLQSSLDGKLATNGDASGLTNFPSLKTSSATNVGALLYNPGGATFSNQFGGTTAIFPNGIVATATSTNNSFAVGQIFVVAGMIMTNGTLPFTNAFSWGMHLSAGATNQDAGSSRYYIGTTFGYLTNDPTNVVVGWRVKAGTIYAAMHNGTAYSEPFSTNNVFSATTSSHVWAWIEGDGSGEIKWYINGNLLGTSTNGPTNNSWGQYITVSAHNDTGGGTETTVARMINSIVDFK